MQNRFNVEAHDCNSLWDVRKINSVTTNKNVTHDANQMLTGDDEDRKVKNNTVYTRSKSSADI